MVRSPRWAEVRDLALRAEELGFDTVWAPDELLWRTPDGETHGWWEYVAMTGAVAAATSADCLGVPFTTLSDFLRARREQREGEMSGVNRRAITPRHSSGRDVGRDYGQS